MRHSNKRNIIFVCIVLMSFLSQTEAHPERLAQIDFDLQKVFRLYTSPGRDTGIYFPCVVEYATLGSSDDIKLNTPKKFQNMITVYLTRMSAQSTSLKVHCSDKVFVFDVVPSKTRHIDFLKITKTHGELASYGESEHPRLIHNKKPILLEKPRSLRKIKAIYSSEWEDKGVNRND